MKSPKYITLLFTFLVPIIFLLSNCSKVMIKPSETDQNVEDFEFAWKIINDTYQYFEWKNINWDSLYYVYKERAEKANGDEFFQVINDMLAELKDGHVYYQTNGGGYVYPYLTPKWLKDRFAYNPLVVRNYFDKELITTANDEFDYGVLDGNIGYVYISRFQPNGIADLFTTVLNALINTDGLIIDIRNNQGGNRWDAHLIVSRFLKESLETPVYYKLGEPAQFPPIEPYGVYQYTKPVVVLINGASFSASECFADLMKQIPHVTVIGDTTGGGSSGYENTVPYLEGRYRLSSGIIIKIPTIDSRCYDGTPWESVGVPPDVRIEQTEDDANMGVDKQLKYAISTLRGY